jgi:PIN domain nuclease of toxin-antitoxin system
MKYLLDTHLLLWACVCPGALPNGVPQIINGPGELYFSSMSIWEIGIKRALNKIAFMYDPGVIRTALVGAGYLELAMSSDHAIAASSLPHIHGDPFDRALIGQAQIEGMILLTHDATLQKYSAHAAISYFP